jgi:hypothetical protein
LNKLENKHYEIKCNYCNHEWIVPQYYISGEMVHCPKCEKKSGKTKRETV